MLKDAPINEPLVLKSSRAVPYLTTLVCVQNGFKCSFKSKSQQCPSKTQHLGLRVFNKMWFVVITSQQTRSIH